MSIDTPTSAVDHTMTRIDIATGIPFDRFRSAFEAAAPAFDPAPFHEIARSGGTWRDVEAAVADRAPHGLLVYGVLDGTPLMALAGHRVKAVEYLLGNHVIAETMFRHDPHALLYAPLRVLLYSDAAGGAVFSIDRPSTVFAGLHHDDITPVGVLLDGKVAGLLSALGVDVGDAFAAAT
jgi:hypothetical protein